MKQHAQDVTGRVNVSLPVTKEAIDYILTTAFEGGSNYWLEGVELAEPAQAAARKMPEGTLLSAALAYYNLPLLLTYNDGDPKTLRLTREGLHDGLALFFDQGGTFGVLLRNPDWEDPGDANDCDSILQLALFKTQIFG